ncbi:MAG TPA: PAS domain S-box protein [Methanospirillum sp.]|nr:PAS domain S-box protein [Methanospirillum sp.]
MIRILHIDDDENFLTIGKKILERLGEFEVSTVRSARSALNRLSDESFDVIISDYQMPDMDGIALLKSIRSSKSIPFIFFTGKGREEVVIEALNNGADYYLQKGGDIESVFTELAHKIQQAAHHHQTEDALILSEEKLRRIINTTQEGVWEIDLSYQTVFVNARLCDLLGYTHDEMIGRQFIDFMFPEDIPDHLEKYPVDWSGSNMTYECKFRHKDGHTIWTILSATPTYDKDQIVGTFSMITDISERKKAEEELSRSEKEFRALFEHTEAATIIIEGDTVISRVNDAYARLINLPRSEIEGKRRWTEFVEPEDLKQMLYHHQQRRIDQNQAPSVYEFHLRDASGLIHPILLHVGMIPGTSKSVASLLDVSSLKEKEQDLKKKNDELLESEILYRAIFENTGSATIIIDENGTILLANSEMERLSGYSRIYVEGKKSWTEFVHPEDRIMMEEYNQKRVVDPLSVPKRYEFRIITRSGEIRDVVNHMALIPGTKRSIASVLDITERKKAEYAVRANEKKFRDLFTNIIDAVILYEISEDGTAGVILEANRVFTEWIPLTIDEICRSTPDRFIAQGHFHDQVASPEPDSVFTFFTELSGQPGPFIPVEVHLRVITYNGRRAGLAVLHDISERQKFEEERNAILVQIERNLGELAILNDGIRNPLAVILGQVDLYAPDIGPQVTIQVRQINEMVNNLDARWNESEKILKFLRRHYRIGHTE